MGLGQGADITWLAVKNGKFIRGKKDEMQEEYRTLDGQITAIDFRDKEYNGNTWREVVISVSDDGSTYKFGVGVGSGYGKQLLAKVATADVTQPMTFEPTYSEEGGKKSSGFFVTQGMALKQLWTRNNPNGMPEMTSTTFGGKTLWDDSEQVAFIEEFYRDHIIPELVQAGDSHAESHAEHGDPSDDMPF